MKKIISLVLAFCFSLPCIALLSACGSTKEKAEQAGTVALSGAHQIASGDVLLNIDSANYSLDNPPSIEVTADGGDHWYSVTAESVSDPNGSSSTLIFRAITYYVPGTEHGEGYYFAGNSSVKAGNVGDSLTLAARLAETNDYKAGRTSQSINYTLKEVNTTSAFNESLVFNMSPFSLDDSNVELYRSYVVLVREDSAFFITDFDITEEADSRYSATPREITDSSLYSNYEYKFVSFGSVTDHETGANFELFDTTFYEDSVSTTGWTNYDAETGIGADDYSAFTGEYEVEYGEITHYYTVAYMLIREKETALTTVSSTSAVKLIIAQN